MGGGGRGDNSSLASSGRNAAAGCEAVAGSRVRLRGLMARSDLNGSFATLRARSGTADGRWKCDLDADGTIVEILPSNFEVLVTEAEDGPDPFDLLRSLHRAVTTVSLTAAVAKSMLRCSDAACFQLFNLIRECLLFGLRFGSAAGHEQRQEEKQEKEVIPDLRFLIVVPEFMDIFNKDLDFIAHLCNQKSAAAFVEQLFADEMRTANFYTEAAIMRDQELHLAFKSSLLGLEVVHFHPDPALAQQCQRVALEEVQLRPGRTWPNRYADLAASPGSTTAGECRGGNARAASSLLPAGRDTEEFVAGPEVERIGIAFFQLPPDPLVLGQVTPQSWAARVGFRRGDEVLEVNGVDAQRLTADLLERALRERPVRFKLKRAALAFDSPEAVAAAAAAVAGKVEGQMKDAAAKVEGQMKDAAAKVEGQVKDAAAKVEGQVKGVAGQVKGAAGGFVKNLQARNDGIGTAAIAAGGLVAAFRDRAQATASARSGGLSGASAAVNGLLRTSVRQDRQDPSTGSAATATLYLPKELQGAVVLIEVERNRWRVDNSDFGTGTQGLGYRRSKNLADRDGTNLAKWGMLVEGIDAGDGWVRCDFLGRAPSTEVPTSLEAALASTPTGAPTLQPALFSPAQRVVEPPAVSSTAPPPTATEDVDTATVSKASSVSKEALQCSQTTPHSAAPGVESPLASEPALVTAESAEPPFCGPGGLFAGLKVHAAREADALSPMALAELALESAEQAAPMTQGETGPTADRASGPDDQVNAAAFRPMALAELVVAPSAQAAAAETQGPTAEPTADRAPEPDDQALSLEKLFEVSVLGNQSIAPSSVQLETTDERKTTEFDLLDLRGEVLSTLPLASTEVTNAPVADIGVAMKPLAAVGHDACLSPSDQGGTEQVRKEAPEPSFPPVGGVLHGDEPLSTGSLSGHVNCIQSVLLEDEAGNGSSENDVIPNGDDLDAGEDDSIGSDKVEDAFEALIAATRDLHALGISDIPSTDACRDSNWSALDFSRSDDAEMHFGGILSVPPEPTLAAELSLRDFQDFARLPPLARRRRASAEVLGGLRAVNAASTELSAALAPGPLSARQGGEDVSPSSGRGQNGRASSRAGSQWQGWGDEGGSADEKNEAEDALSALLSEQTGMWKHDARSVMRSIDEGCLLTTPALAYLESSLASSRGSPASSTAGTPRASSVFSDGDSDDHSSARDDGRDDRSVWSDTPPSVSQLGRDAGTSCPQPFGVHLEWRLEQPKRPELRPGPCPGCGRRLNVSESSFTATLFAPQELLNLNKPRYCHYLGSYFCSSCHQGDLRVIPARVVESWNFEPKRVCTESAKYLEAQVKQPLVPITKVRRTKVATQKTLTEVHLLRQQLTRIKAHVAERSCDFQELLEARLSQMDPHVAQGHDLYSMQDLICLEQQGRQCLLFSKLSCLAIMGADHIRGCPTCKQSARWCRICSSQAPLFAFEVGIYYECSDCHSVFHQECFKRAGSQCLVCMNRQHNVSVAGIRPR